MIGDQSCITDVSVPASEVRQTSQPLINPTLSPSQSKVINSNELTKIPVANKRLLFVHAKQARCIRQNKNKEVVSVKKIFGYELILDLYGCDKNVITSRKKLKEYVDSLCKLIKMKQFGKTLIPYFGQKAAHTKGYSLVQLIETSSITGHFSDYWQTAYINIFSCKQYDHKKAEDFTRNFFKAKKVKVNFLTR